MCLQMMGSITYRKQRLVGFPISYKKEAFERMGRTRLKTYPLQTRVTPKP